MAKPEKIDVRDLRSVRVAASEAQESGVILGEDWMTPHDELDPDLLAMRKLRSSWPTLRSALARRIVMYSMIPVVIMIVVLLLALLVMGAQGSWQIGPGTVLIMGAIGFAAAIVVSMNLAATIAHPITDLAAAAELGQRGDPSQSDRSRVRLPDLTARPDEIGRLSSSLRDLVTALYNRIDANEQFAADVAHEIKNPLASLQSAVSGLEMAKTDAQRQKLLAVIQQDVKRLDRLVGDISRASRLDSELVREDQTRFNLIAMLSVIGESLEPQFREGRIRFETDFPTDTIEITGLENRLGQVFMNLMSNAVSFCEPESLIRVWVRRRAGRVLVVVEDTGPGIPDDDLQKIFTRFYSQRPEHQFGQNSGLGLSISKQIVEAHGGVIWAENIRAADAPEDSPPLGARFIVGLPL